MKFITTICTNLRRFRNRRGFGVHSPLAFKLLTEVMPVSGMYGYYADEEIDFLACQASKKSREQYMFAQRAKMMLRLSNFFGIEEIQWLSADTIPEIYTQSIKGASGHQNGRCKKMALLPCDNKACDMRYLSEADNLLKSKEAVIILYDYKKEDMERLYQNLEEGLLLESDSIAILISKEMMMKVRYLF